MADSVMLARLAFRFHSRAYCTVNGALLEGHVGFLFPGQGSQHVGMCRQLLHLHGVRELFETARKVLGYDLLSICLNGPAELLSRTDICQPAVVVASLAAVERLKSNQPEVGVPPCYGSVTELHCPRRQHIQNLHRGSYCLNRNITLHTFVAWHRAFLYSSCRLRP